MRKVVYKDFYSGQYLPNYTELGYFHEWITNSPNGIFALIENQDGTMRVVNISGMKFVEEFPQKGEVKET